MSTLLYSYGLPFSEKLGENLDALVKRVEGNKAALIIIDGGIGEGKTTLAIQVMNYLNTKFKLPNVNLEIKNHPQLALGGAQFLQNLRTCYEDSLPTITYDEAGDFNRRGSLTRFNAIINRTFETFRAFKIIVILCLPSFHVLDADLFDKKIPRLLLHLRDRTQAQGNLQGYSLYRMFYLKNKMEKLIVKPFAYGIVEPNFRGHFLDLDKEASDKLDKISTKGKMDVLKKSEIESQGLLSYADLARKIGRSVIWVRIAVGKLKLKPKKVINRLKYFDESTLNRLMDHLDDFQRRGKK